MTENELAECFTTLVGLNPEGGGPDLGAFECDGMYHHVQFKVVSKNLKMRLKLHGFDSLPLKLCVCWTDAEDVLESEIPEVISMETFASDILGFPIYIKEILHSSQEGMLSPSGSEVV